MSLTKSLLPALAISSIAVGVLAGCSTSTSDVKTTGEPKSGVSLRVDDRGAELDALPSDIPYLTSYYESKATGDQATGDFQLTLRSTSKNAVQDAADKLTEAGFTSTGRRVYTSSTWKVTLDGVGGQVTYAISRNR